MCSTQGGKPKRRKVSIQEMAHGDPAPQQALRIPCPATAGEQGPGASSGENEPEEIKGRICLGCGKYSNTWGFKTHGCSSGRKKHGMRRKKLQYPNWLGRRITLTVPVMEALNATITKSCDIFGAAGDCTHARQVLDRAPNPSPNCDTPEGQRDRQ